MEIELCVHPRLLNTDDGPFMFLRDRLSKSAIVIGVMKETAASIFAGMCDNSPYTLIHDDIKNILVNVCGLKVVKAMLTCVKDQHFQGKLFLERSNGEKVSVDFGVTDCIALAVRFKAPIVIEEQLFIEILDDESNQNFLDALERAESAAGVELPPQE